MAPAVIEILDELPTLVSGKVDRKGLAARAGRAPTVEPDDAPQTEAEEAVAKIWAEVLGREKVGRGQDFFAMGGHSLLAAQILSKIRTGLQVELPLSSLFGARTVARFAELIEEALIENLEGLSDDEAQQWAAR
jgi:acyl carrier protein